MLNRDQTLTLYSFYLRFLLFCHFHSLPEHCPHIIEGVLIQASMHVLHGDCRTQIIHSVDVNAYLEFT